MIFSMIGIYVYKYHDKKITEYTKAIEINPDDSEAYKNRGNKYAELQQYDKGLILTFDIFKLLDFITHQGKF